MREETGFDIQSTLVEEDCIEMHIGQQRSKLFIITGVRACHTITQSKLLGVFALVFRIRSVS